MKYFSIFSAVFLCLSIAILIFTFTYNSKAEIEIRRFTYNVEEETDRLQFDYHMEVANPTGDIQYLTLAFPSYIVDSLVTPQSPVQLPANSSTLIDSVFSVKKDGGAEMTKDTINALLKKELPAVSGFIIGKSYVVSEKN